MKCSTNIPNTKGETAQEIPLNEDGDCLLHTACQWGDLGIVKYLITDERCHLNIQNIHLNTPLHVACNLKLLHIIGLFLERRCSTHLVNKKGETAQDIPLNKDGDCLLHVACLWGDVEIVRYLVIEEQCTTNIPNYSWNTPLHIACYKKSLNIIKLLLGSKCSTNIPNKKRETAQDIPLSEDGDHLLHIACQWGDVNIMKHLIIEENSDINLRNYSWNTPLHIACYKKSLHIIKLLLERKCSTNIPNKKGETAHDIPLNEDGDCLLHIACQWGDVDIVKYLITNERCALNAQNGNGDTALHIACYLRYFIIIRILLEKKCSTNLPNKKEEIAQDIPLNDDGDCLLHIACQWGDVNIMRHLTIEKNGDIDLQNYSGNTPLHIACYNKSLSIIILLLEMRCSANISNEKGVNAKDIPLNDDGDCLLHIACQWGNVNTMRYVIIEENCDINLQNYSGNTPLHIACSRKALNTIKLLLEMRCSTNIPNKKGETAHDIPLNDDGGCLLHTACQWGDVDIVKYLTTDEVCSPNVQSQITENTPLHVAVMYGQDGTIIQLLSCEGCDLNVQNKDGDTPLHHAVRQNKVAIIPQLLSQQQCNINIQNKVGDTPLHIAATIGQHDATVQLLLRKECSLNVQNKDGDTPLHHAVRQNNTAEVSQLLAHQQCNSKVKNINGDTPLHIACYRRTLPIIRHLLERRCSTSIPNKKGETAQIIPLNEDGDHVLLSYEKCDLNIRNGEGDTPLHNACYRKSLDIIRFLLKRRCSTNIPNKKGETSQEIPLNEDGDTLLHIACQWGDVDIVRYLITDERCDPNIQSYTSENTPLHIAVKHKQSDLTAQLLSYKECDPSIQNKCGDTPLHTAIRQNQTTTISQLLAHLQCSTNVQNKVGDTPLHVAATYGHDDATDQLLSCEECDLNIQNTNGDTALHVAVRRNKAAVVSKLLAHQQCNANAQNKMGDTPLHIAATSGQHDATDQLLSCKECDLNIQNTNGDTPLHVAVRQNNTAEISKLLAHQKCSINVQNQVGDTPLPIAVKGDKTVKPVATKQCNPNAQNIDAQTPLQTAVTEMYDGTIVELLSSNKCDLNIQNKEGDTPLHIAVRQNKTAAISNLLAHQQCNTSVKNINGDTPLHIACYKKSLHIIKLLLERKCSTNIPNKKGETAQNIPLNEDGDCLLHIACQWGDVDIVSYLVIDERCDPNIQSYTSENTPLHIAVKHEQHDATAQLLSCKECDPSIQNKCGDTPLHTAIRQNRTTTISQLLAHLQCSTNIQNKVGDTPLHVAATYGHDDATDQLLSCEECDLNIQNMDGDTALHVAVRQNNTAEISKLLAHQKCNTSVKNISGDTPLHIACYKKSLHIIKLLLERKCSTNIPNMKGETAHDIPLNVFGDHLLHIACQWVDVDIVKYLVTNERCDPNVKNLSTNTPLHVACYRKSFVIIRFFLERRCHTNIPNKKGETAQDIPLNDDGDCLLHIACQWGDADIVRYLVIDENCDACISNGFGNTPLHVACYLGLLDIIRFFLEQKCSTNIPNKKGETAHEIPLNEDGDCLLHVACQWADVSIVRYLIADQKCNINIQNTHLNTAMHVACHMKLLHIIRLLLEMRCSTNIPNKKGETAQNIPLNENGDCLLHIACQWGDVDIVEYLINDERCDPNVQNVFKNTPLHIAVIYGQLNYTTTVQLLSYKECNLNIQNEKGDTPLHIACYWKSHNIIRLFLERRCSTNIPNKKGETAQNIPLNEDGDGLLHIACQWGDVDIVKYLVTDERCDPNIQSSMSKNTPLHIAVEHGQDDTIVQLLSCEECDLNIQNEDGDTPLHFAVGQTKIAAIFHLLASERCNSKVQNKEGDTPLHIACYRKSFHVIRLLLERNCSTNISNKKGETAQDIPLNEDGDCLLHIACQWGDMDIFKYLIIDQRCNFNIHNANLNTPLHMACYAGSIDITRLLLEWRCSTNIPNKKGETAQNIPLNEDGDCLLHVACQWGDVDIVRYLINNGKCNPNLQSSTTKNTPLHIASEHCQNDLITQLLSYEGCDLDIQNMEGDTPLHVAARHNITPAVFYLLASKPDNPNILNKDNLSPLLVAIKHYNTSAATTLLQHKDCDPTLCDPHGNTPLHLACIAGETRPEMVKVAKLLLTTVDPTCVNNAGQTPIELTTNYQLIQAISTFIKCETKQSVQTYINLFVVGNPETGKSTLVKAICKEATSFLWKVVPKNIRRVKNVPLHTAGIIPTTFRSKTFGNTVLYDLAGQVEYYTSHAAVIQSTVISTPPAFIVVVNLSESDEKISQTLHYWWSFIDNHAAQSSEPPQVILVGSHADIVKSTGKSVQEKMTQISLLLKKLPATFRFAGQVALDCRDPASKNLRHFCILVTQSCSVLRQTADVDLHCHVLYAFLLERFQGKVACTVSDVTSSVKETSALLPQNADSLIPLISTLSDKGLLLLVKNGESHGDWWVILQKQALLGEINGAIFAPRNFKQHKDLSWSTGVVPFFKLKQEFPDYNPNMVTEFLINLEFCFKIEDRETLALLKDEGASMQDTSPDASEKYYFFPALVSVRNPLHVWEENDDMCCKCGWFYQSIQQDQFLTTQFLHVLILRLAFTFALKLDPGDSREDSLSLCRKCSVWNRGIGWLYKVPIETVVEVGLQHQSVIVMMRCPKGMETKCVQLRSEVIQKVLEAKDEHCKAVKMS